MLDARAGAVEVDQLVMQTQAVVSRLFLVHRGGQRTLDAGADEAEEQFALVRLRRCARSVDDGGGRGGVEGPEKKETGVATAVPAQAAPCSHGLASSVWSACAEIMSRDVLWRLDAAWTPRN